MSKYPLTEKQKQLLRSIAPGLQDGTVKTEWLISLAASGIGIHGLDRDGTLWRQVWKDRVSLADFDVFVQYGFFIETHRERHSRNYSLNVQMIIDAVNNDFEISEAAGVLIMGDQINLSGNISGSNINIGSTLTSVTQSISAMPHGDQVSRDELIRLMEQLNQELQAVPPEHEEAAEDVAKDAESLVEALNKEQPNKQTVERRGERLKKAAEDLAAIAPNVLVIANQFIPLIAAIVANAS